MSGKNQETMSEEELAQKLGLGKDYKRADLVNACFDLFSTRKPMDLQALMALQGHFEAAIRRAMQVIDDVCERNRGGLL